MKFIQTNQEQPQTLVLHGVFFLTGWWLKYPVFQDIGPQTQNFRVKIKTYIDVYLEENHPNGPANSMKAECLKYPLKVSNRSTPTTQRTLVLEDFEPLKMARSTFQNTSNSRVFALGCRDRMVKVLHIYSYIFLSPT